MYNTKAVIEIEASVHTTHICIGSLCPRILPVTVSDCTPLLTSFESLRTRGRNLARAAEMSVGDRDQAIARIAGRALHMLLHLGYHGEVVLPGIVVLHVTGSSCSNCTERRSDAE